MAGLPLSLLIVIVLLEVTTVAVTTHASEQKCTLEELNGCLEAVKNITQRTDLAFAATRFHLHAVCSILKISVHCIDDHMKYCFTATQRKVFNHVVAGARQFLSELCIPGAIQEAYLLYAPCFKNISLSEEKCAPQYQRLMFMSEKVNEEPNVDKGIKESCCAFDAFVSCKHNYASQDCGSEAAKFLQQHLDRITNPLLHEHCAPYMFGKGTCDLNSTARGGTVSPFLTFTVFLLFLKFWIAIYLIDR